MSAPVSGNDKNNARMNVQSIRDSSVADRAAPAQLGLPFGAGNLALAIAPRKNSHAAPSAANPLTAAVAARPKHSSRGRVGPAEIQRGIAAKQQRADPDLTGAQRTHAQSSKRSGCTPPKPSCHERDPLRRGALADPVHLTRNSSAARLKRR